MKIGIDIDEVITEYLKHFLNFMEVEKKIFLNYENFSSYSFENHLDLTIEEVKNYINEHTLRPSTLIELNLIEGSLEAIEFLEKNHEIIFITSRNIINKEKTFEFFKKHFPDKEFQIVFSGDAWGGAKSKAEICSENKCKIMIEDNMKYASDCVGKGVKTILFDKPWNQDERIHENLVRVSGWKEALEKIKEIENEY